jgi:hypothetical protein
MFSQSVWYFCNFIDLNTHRPIPGNHGYELKGSVATGA